MRVRILFGRYTLAVRNMAGEAMRKVTADQSSGHSLVLVEIKLLHTAIWAFMVSCILGMPMAAYLGHFRLSALLAVPVLIEILVLAANGFRCPLTDLAGNYTTERSPDFDIYLPVWLARNTKVLFGGLFVVNGVISVWFWARNSVNFLQLR